MTRHLLLAVAILLGTLAPRGARACGGFFSEASAADVVAMSDLRVLLIQRPGEVEQLVQVGYAGSARSFAWVYPVAGNPEVSEAVASPFAALEELTRPRITIALPQTGGGGGGGFGCGASDAVSMPGDRSQEAPPRVKVWQSGQVGSFDYVVISATRVEEMLTWLGDNGFAVPAATSDVLGHYLALGWYFVAMKVAVEARDAEVPATTVIRLRYAASELRYPLRMVSLSPAAATSLELYLVAAEQLVPVSPFRQREIDVTALKATSATTHNYDQVFAAALADGGPRTLVREYGARGWDPTQIKLDADLAGMVLTRYRTTFGSEVMNEDLLFVPAPLDTLVQSHRLIYGEGSAPAALPLAAPLGCLALLGLRWLRRRRRAGGAR